MFSLLGNTDTISNILRDMEEALLEDNPRAELNIGLEHHKAGRLAQAEKIYKKVLTANPQNAEALHLMGLASHHSGRNEQAIEYIANAIKNDKTSRAVPKTSPKAVKMGIA